MPTSKHIDVSETAAEVGHGFMLLKAPVLLTEKLWRTCVQWDESDSEAQDYQEQEARLWDVLFVCGIGLQNEVNQFLRTMTYRYSIYVVPRDGKSTEAVKANLVASGIPHQGALLIDVEGFESPQGEAY